MVGWHHHLNGHYFEQLWERVKDKEAWHAEAMGSMTEEQEHHTIVKLRTLESQCILISQAKLNAHRLKQTCHLFLLSLHSLYVLRV